LHGTIGYGLKYFSSGEVILQGYIDFDWEESAIGKLSTLGCYFILGSITFSGKKVFVALSTIETKYIIANVTICEAVWLQNLLARLHSIHDV
jgi:hypothetical protein